MSVERALEIVQHLSQVARSNDDVTSDEMRWELAMAQHGHVMNVITDEEKEYIQELKMKIKEHDLLLEWDFPDELALASPKVGVCGAFCAMIDFKEMCIDMSETKKLLDRVNFYIRLFLEKPSELKLISNHLISENAGPIIPLVRFATNLQEKRSPCRGFAEDAARLAISVMAPEKLDFGVKDVCYVGKSDRHGKGVFATRDIQKGELVTLYPQCFIRMDGDCHEAVKLFATGVYEGWLEQYSMNNDKLLRHGESIELLPCVRTVENPQNGVLGHIINSPTKSKLIRRVVFSVANVESAPFLGGTVIGIFASINISKDEELLLDYGTRYDWEGTRSATTAKLNATTSIISCAEKRGTPTL